MALMHNGVTCVKANVVKVIIGQSVAHVSDWWKAHIQTIIIVAVIICIIVIDWCLALGTIWVILKMVSLILSLLFPRVSTSSFAAPRLLRCHLCAHVLWRRVNLDANF